MNVVISSKCWPPFGHSTNYETDEEFISSIDIKPVTIQYTVNHEVCARILFEDCLFFSVQQKIDTSSWKMVKWLI